MFNIFMYKVYLTHFMCADDSIHIFRNCWKALKAQGSARLCFFFSFFSAQTQEHQNHWNSDLDWFIKTGKYRGAAHWKYDVNLKLTKKVPAIFHNLKGYDNHLIINEIGKFNVKVDVIPNRLEKYMAVTININLVFIDRR